MHPLIKRLKEMIFKNLNNHQTSGFFKGATHLECEELKKAGKNTNLMMAKNMTSSCRLAISYTVHRLVILRYHKEIT